MKSVMRYFGFIVLICAAASSTSAATLDNWTWRNPAPTGNNMLGLTYGNGLFVAVGNGGTILTSADGVNWTQQLAPPNANLAAVTYGLGMFAAVGIDSSGSSANVILTSADGTSWTQVLGGLGTAGLNAVTFGGGEFVAVGTAGNNLSSSDGIVWTPGSNSITGSAFGVVYANNEFVAVASGGGISTSPSGNSWSSQNSGTPYGLNAVTYANGVFAAVGNSVFLVSPNGTNWTTAHSGDFANTVIPVNTGLGTFFAAAGTHQQLFTSPDGTNWTIYYGPDLNSIAFNGTLLAGVGAGGLLSESLDAVHWVNTDVNATTQPMAAVAYGFDSSGNGVFVAAGGELGGNGAVVFSPDGYHWQAPASAVTSNTLFFTSISGVTYGALTDGGSEFVAAANYYSGLPAGVILSSTNGSDWVSNSVVGSFTTLTGITHGQDGAGNPLFVVAASRATLYSSGDLANWTTNSLNSFSEFYGVTWGIAAGGPRFVAVGANGLTAVSSNGSAWTTNGVGGNNLQTLYSVTFGNGQFVAVGASGVIFTSPDGASWQKQVSPTTDTLNGVFFNNGYFVAVGGYFGSVDILVSSDAVTWTRVVSGSGNTLNAVGAGNPGGNSQFIAAGAGGDILGTVVGSLSAAHYSVSSGVFQFQVCGPPGKFGVYVSQDFLNWSNLTDVTFTFSSPCQTVQDPGGKTNGYYYLGSP